MKTGDGIKRTRRINTRYRRVEQIQGNKKANDYHQAKAKPDESSLQQMLQASSSN